LAEIENQVTNERYHRSERFLADDCVFGMTEEPGDLSKVAGRKKWLAWWADELEKITQDWGRITVLISPSKEYDGWIKMVAKEMQVKGACIEQGAKAIA